ncbi:hypothetical protein BD413DRAFT_647054 [Trametes elegans]|nr:hypothetical protein BD413DRAFT_647054 [Trametes elegans]
MTDILYPVSHMLRNAIVSRATEEVRVPNVHDWMSRVSLGLLGHAGLGHSFDNFEDDVPDPYNEAFTTFLTVNRRIAALTLSIGKLSHIFPKWLLWRILRATPQADVRRLV